MKDKESMRHVLRQLIKEAQVMIMEGMGDDEEAGEALSEKLSDGMMSDEEGEYCDACDSKDCKCEEEYAEEGHSDDEDDFEAYKKSEMKKGNKSPLKDRAVAVTFGSRKGY